MLIVAGMTAARVHIGVTELNDGCAVLVGDWSTADGDVARASKAPRQ
jgi:hypothetical protein